MKRLFATPSAIASNAKSEWVRLYVKKSKRKSKGERNRVLSSAPNKNKTNPDGKSEFVLFFTRDYFGVICKFRK